MLCTRPSEAWLQVSSFINFSSSFAELASLLKLNINDLASLAIYLGSVIPSLPLSSAITWEAHTHLGFKDQNSVFHILVANALSTELFPQLLDTKLLQYLKVKQYISF